MFLKNLPASNMTKYIVLIIAINISITSVAQSLMNLTLDNDKCNCHIELKDFIDNVFNSNTKYQQKSYKTYRSSPQLDKSIKILVKGSLSKNSLIFFISNVKTKEQSIVWHLKSPTKYEDERGINTSALKNDLDILFEQIDQKSQGLEIKKQVKVWHGIDSNIETANRIILSKYLINLSDKFNNGFFGKEFFFIQFGEFQKANEVNGVDNLTGWASASDNKIIIRSSLILEKMDSYDASVDYLHNKKEECTKQLINNLWNQYHPK